jgi:hypothetical protein
MALGLGLLETGIGLWQKSKAEKALKDSQEKANRALEAIETKEVDPLVAARYNAAMPGETEAQQNIGQTQTQALGSAKTRKGGLASVAGIVGQTNKAKQNLAVQKGQYKLGAEKQLVGERNAALQSRQQKEGLMANIALQEVGAARSELSQGLGGIGSGLGNLVAGGGNLSGIGKGIGKGFGFLKGMFGKKAGSFGADALGNPWNNVPGIE